MDLLHILACVIPLLVIHSICQKQFITIPHTYASVHYQQ